MSRKLLASALPLILAAVFGFFAYTSCDQLADEKSSDNKTDSDGGEVTLPKAKGATCDELKELESYPVQYRQGCVVEGACAGAIEIPVAADGNTSTISVTDAASKQDIKFEYDAGKKAILIAQENCPDAGSEIAVAYIGKKSDANDNGTIDNANFSCTTAIGKSDPAFIQTSCTVKEACDAAETYKIPLHASFNPIDGLVDLTRTDLKQPSIVLTYDKDAHQVTVDGTHCAQKDVVFVIGYKGEQRQSDCTDDGGDCLDAPDNAGFKKLYKHPCGNFDPVPVSCDNAGGFVDFPNTAFKTCAELGLSEGSNCPAGLEKCIYIQQKACKNTPTTKAASAFFLHCSTEAITEMNCPASERRHKTGINYVSADDLNDLRNQIVNLKLARYEYKDQEMGAGSQLGFIIDDQPDADFVTADGKRVNMYAYVSSLVAALQVQQKEIDQLRRELESLKSR